MGNLKGYQTAFAGAASMEVPLLFELGTSGENGTVLLPEYVGHELTVVTKVFFPIGDQRNVAENMPTAYPWVVQLHVFFLEHPELVLSCDHCVRRGSVSCALQDV